MYVGVFSKSFKTISNSIMFFISNLIKHASSIRFKYNFIKTKWVFFLTLRIIFLNILWFEINEAEIFYVTIKTFEILKRKPSFFIFCN